MTDCYKYLRYLFYHVKRRFVWWQKWVILIKKISSEEPFPDTPAGYILRLATKEDYPALTAAYPKEFSGHLPEAVKRKQLMARANRMKCFLITDQAGQIKGACWCSPYKNAAIRPQGVDQKRLFEMMNTFIVDNARGIGLSEVLRRFAIANMAAEGYRAVISFVWYSRTGSLKMNLNTGSRVLGEKTLYSILGFRWFRYRPYASINKLPINFSAKVFILGRDESRLYRFLNELSLFGIPAECAMLEAGRLSRLKIRVHGFRVTATSATREQGGSLLTALENSEGGFLVPIDDSGEQVLLALKKPDMPEGFQQLLLSREQLAISSSRVSDLPFALLAAAGIGHYFHEWSAE